MTTADSVYARYATCRSTKAPTTKVATAKAFILRHLNND